MLAPSFRLTSPLLRDETPRGVADSKPRNLLMRTQQKRQAMRLQLRDALNQLEANPSPSQAILRANVTGKIESGNGVAIVERGEA